MTFVRLGAYAALFISLAAPLHARAEIGRDDQWSYVAAGRYGGPAAELRADGRRPAEHLLFRVSCERAARTLVMDYFPGEGFDDLLPKAKATPLELILDDRSEVLPTQRAGAILTGRLKLTPDLVRRVQQAKEVFLYGPSDMDEPWYAGAAGPLRRVARECL